MLAQTLVTSYPPIDPAVEMTAREVSQTLGCSIGSVHALGKQGLLEYRKVPHKSAIGYQLVYTRDSINGFQQKYTRSGEKSIRFIPKVVHEVAFETVTPQSEAPGASDTQAGEERFLVELRALTSAIEGLTSKIH